MKGIILLAVIHALIIYQSQKKRSVSGIGASQMAAYADNQKVNKPSEDVLWKEGKIIINNGIRYAFMPYYNYSKILAAGR